MSRLLLRRGNKVDLPVLNVSEPGFALDTKELFIGHSSGNQRIPIVPSLSAAPWIAPTLLNSWVNFGSSWADAGYFKDDLGFVHLHGLIKSGVATAFTTLFTLPVGYRPLFKEMVTTASNNGTSTIITTLEIQTNGSIAIGGSGASNSYLLLDNILFRAEQ